MAFNFKTAAWRILLLGFLATFVLPARAQLVADPGFELGADSHIWVMNAGATFSETNAHEGTHCVKIAAHGTILQKIQNLNPSTAYVLSAYIMIDGPGKAVLGVQNYGGKFVSTKQTAAPVYQLVKLNFTTGASDTSAEILLSNGSDSGTVFADDLDLTPSPPDAASAPATPPAPATP